MMSSTEHRYSSETSHEPNQIGLDSIGSTTASLDTDSSDLHLHAVILAGGQGMRLGNVSKADLVISGKRLLTTVLRGLEPYVGGTVVVVAPPTVSVPSGVIRTMEDPPLGGPLAGVAAGLDKLETQLDSDLVVVCAVDTPRIGDLLPLLNHAFTFNESDDADGAVALTGGAEAQVQYLQGIYRLGALRSRLSEVPKLRNSKVRTALEPLNLYTVAVPASMSRDVDTPADIAWWMDQFGEPPVLPL